MTARSGLIRGFETALLSEKPRSRRVALQNFHTGGSVRRVTIGNRGMSMKRSMSRLNGMATVAGAIAALTWGAAGAQQAPQGAQAQSSPISGGLEEVVVTAQRRSENIQNVPIAITAYTAEVLQS